LAKKHTPRAEAALIISDVIKNHRSLSTLFAKHLPLLKDNERSLCQQLCYGVLREHEQLNVIAAQLIKKPLKSKDTDVLALLLLGLYQIRSMRIPEHAALSETVNATKVLNKPWATGLINASLRNYLRHREQIDLSETQSETATYSHPQWLLSRFQKDWPEQWTRIAEANNQHPPMFLRVNQQSGSQSNYLERLVEANIPAEALENTAHGIHLTSPCDVYLLPGFTDGHVSVQDGAAQRVIDLLDIQSNQRILDACAAPGGKTCHILETNPDNEVIALDIDADRLQQIHENTARLHLKAKCIASDAADVETWWDGKLFDRILIDAPCSGTGVIRRHPDIKLLRRPEDIDQLAKKQAELLEKLWPLLKPEGLLVYTTCSILKQENEQQIQAFLSVHSDAHEVEVEHPPATRRAVGYQRLPGEEQLDGFYYACLRRQ
jgi:16S rRNA (cytosine967-C5)-methyltransferase